MEDSFTQYRDKTGVESGSETEFIDNSFVEEITYSVKKKVRPVFVAESEESGTDDCNDVENGEHFTSKATTQSSIIAGNMASNDDQRSSIGRKSDSCILVLSSSDEGEASPEILPKRPPLMRPKFNGSILGEKTKKRLLLLDSDSDNSIIIEKNRNKKLLCLKDTPLKIDSGNKIENADISMEYGDHDDSTSSTPLKDKTRDDEESVNNNDGKNSVSDLTTDEEESSDEDNDPKDNDANASSIIKKNRNNLNSSDTDNSIDDGTTSSNSDSNAKCKSPLSSTIKREVRKKNVIESSDEESDNIRKPTKYSKKNRKKVISSDSSFDSEDDHSPLLRSEERRITKGNELVTNENYEVNKKATDVETNSAIDQDKHTKVHNEASNVRESSEIGENLSNIDEDTDGPDEDLMIMSKATRMSIMGVLPKGYKDSDESDLIESDSSHRNSSDSNSANNPAEYAETSVDKPEISIPVTPVKITDNPDNDGDTSNLTCSPFSSPFRDITNVTLNTKKDDVFIDLNDNKPDTVKDKERSASKTIKENFIKYDDDVTIIDSNPEIIALSSDDEDVVLEEKKSPNMKKSPKARNSKSKANISVSDGASKDNTIKSYLLPPSYPNQIRYVDKKEREKQLNVLEGLRADLANVQNLLEQMDLDTLPDGGKKLLERVNGLEAEIRRQGDMVANMVVAPERVNNLKKEPVVSTWDELQKVSNEVQPRMFGKQAMATHMAERSLILDSLRNLHEALASCPQETELEEQPRDVKTKLMDHQLHALAWLKWRETQRPTGGILADDMGLGKTITMISLIVSDKEKTIDRDDDEYVGNKPPGGTLVVCPASLMQQWENEVQKHCTRNVLSVCLHHGAARAQHPHPLAAHDLVLTTYNIMQRDHEKNGVLMRVNWRRVILDEAHIVRNHKSATSAGVSALVAKRRWCLTGTPVQNKDLDLFALMKFLKCTPFDELTMWKKWIDNKSLGGQERLNTVMRCILLRRTKAQLQARGQLDCLPDRHMHQQHVNLTKAEMNVYQKVLVMSKTLFGQYLHQRAEKNADSVGFVPGKDSEYSKMHKKMIALKGVKLVKSHEILVLLLRLRQICCHCGLIGSSLQGDGLLMMGEDTGSNDLLEELNKLSLEDSKNKRKSGGKDIEEENEIEEEGASVAEALRSVMNKDPVFDMSKPSSKIKAAMDCLQENVFKNKGEKAIVVSQWTGVLRLMEEQLRKANVRCVTLSGSVSVGGRQELINAINDPKSDVKVMLLSLSAGGVGLNLCGANHLLLLDPHWNPQLEEQAKDRIYRVGQKKDVHIYRFMCLDTVEQTIRKLQEVKLELADNVLTGAKNTNASKLSIEDLKMLFNMGEN